MHEYVGIPAAQAAAGMKGLLTVAVKASATTTTATGTTPTSTGTTSTGGTTLTGDPNAGAAVFMSAGCGGCHTLAAAGATGTIGPDLDTSPLTSQQIVLQVTNGGSPMPGFGNSLSPQQIANVAAYIIKSQGH